MKKQSGITLVSLVLYIIVMAIVLVIMNSIITYFYNNTEITRASVKEIIEFNRFNSYFLKEIKLRENAIDRIEEKTEITYILFTSGNSFSMYNNSIYYNDKKICSDVKSMKVKKGKDGDGLNESIINITLNFENFSKIMNYKMENIY